MEKVVLLNAGKTKSGKTVINFGIPVDNNYKKGFEIITQYIEDSNLFSNLKDSNFGIPLECELGYRDTYGGQAFKQIISLFDKDGELIFEI